MSKTLQENGIKENASTLASAYRPLPVPQPMPDVAAYQEERRLRLKSDKGCQDNYNKYLESGRVTASANYLPIKLDIENVSRCNFRCKMCQVSEWHNGKRADDMSLQEFKALIDEQYGLVEIKLQGMGEPLMAGADFFSMIRYARDKHIWVRSVTNASLLHLKNNYRNFIDSGINELQVSIDGADKPTFESIRGGANFEKVKENCQLLNNYCRDVGVDKTKMWTVVQQNNIHQLFELVEFAADTGFKSQVFSLDLTDWGQEKWRSIHNRENQVSGIDQETGWKLVEEGEKKGVKVSFWNISEKYSSNSPEQLCRWPFERAYISSDLRVVPCCMIANPEVLDLGDASNSFTDIWLSDEYSRFRQDHLEGNVPKACRGCYRDNY